MIYTMDRSSNNSRVNDGRRGTRHLALGAVLLVLSHGAAVRAESTVDREYKIKAAFVYNFLKFVEGGRFTPPAPKNKDQADPNHAIVIGILGVPPSKNAFADEENGIPEQHPEIGLLRRCHVLFVCPSERPHLHRILPHLQKDGILTVGDVPAFLEAGGVANLLVEDKKVRFEVNLAAAARAKLVIRSSLLRLAVRTIERDRLDPQTDEENSRETGRS
jgi:hypothetical protein